MGQSHQGREPENGIKRALENCSVEEKSMKSVRKNHAAVFAVAAMVAACGSASAADAPYPTKSVRMIVPFAPGGPTDVIARFVAIKLAERFGQQVVVDNRAGAGGNIGMGMAASSTPDGYTLVIVSSSFVVNPGLYSKIPYDPYKSFAPVTNMAASPNVYTAHPSVAAKSMPELIKLIQANPKKFSFATPGIGTTPDLAASLLKVVAKLDVTTVPFAGAGPAVTAVIGNQVPLGCTALPPTTPHIIGGRLRALAVTSAKRTPSLPDVPSMAEAGFAGQESETLQGVLVPAGTPKAVVQRLHNEIARILAQPDTKERIVGLGFDIVASTPEQFTAQIKSEVEKWSKVVKDAGIKVE
jgi:tripartite-type tricarboxylate transporter receptor subunit TctC